MIEDMIPEVLTDILPDFVCTNEVAELLCGVVYVTTNFIVV